MSITATRAQRRQLERDNAKLPRELQLVPRHEWPNPNGPQRRVWRSRDYLVQEFDAPAPACVRLSVNRTILSGDRWSDNITWDELQDIKAQCGYPMADAVEVYPPAGDVVNVANMRHLWILRERLPFAWRKTPAGSVPHGVGGMSADQQGRYARAVDHFADAKRFAQQAEIAAERGNTDEADAFAKMACEAASSGALEMGHLF